MSDDRIQPQDLAAEESVLGAILLDNLAIEKVASWLRAQDFYKRNHEDVYKACLDLHISGEPVDLITVANRLEQMQVLTRMGGRAFVASLSEGVPTAANIEHYAKIIKEKSSMRQLIRFGGMVSARGYDSPDDVAQTIAEVQRDAFALTEDQITDEPERVTDMLGAFMDELDNGSADPPVWSGLNSLDGMLGGFIPGQLIVVCGRPGMGKSALGLNIGLHAAKQGVASAIFSLEMSKPELVTRFIAQQASIECKRLDKARRGLASPPLSEGEMDRVMTAITTLHPLPLFIDDQGGLTDDVLIAKARRVALREKVGLIVVDYIGLMRSAEDTKGNRVQEVGLICHKLKALAKDLHLPVIAMAQLNRGPEMRKSEDKRPMLSDLRESGDVEQDADVVIGVYRPGYYDPLHDQEEAEAIVLKQRGGSTGICPLRFKEEYTRFHSISYAHSQEIQ